MIDRRALAAVPDPEIPFTPAIERGIADSVAYLASEATPAAIALDPYWPKWDAPWWHLLLLWELGEARQIPAGAAQAMAAGLDGLLHVFPIHPGDAPPGVDLHRDIACHCALGCMAQALAAAGVDVPRALSWVARWFAKYQMADGGLNCDDDAYRVADECPSSMVATISPFEAMIGSGTPFEARAAQFLVERALVRGSGTVQNAVERTAALAWVQPCFPRFYFYDVLRGLSALARWADTTGAALPAAAIAPAVQLLLAHAPDGVVHVERHGHGGKGTLLPTADRSPSPRAPASSFALLDATSVIGAPSAALTREWTAARRAILRTLDEGRII